MRILEFNLLLSDAPSESGDGMQTKYYVLVMCNLWYSFCSFITTRHTQLLKSDQVLLQYS